MRNDLIKQIKEKAIAISEQTSYDVRNSIDTAKLYRKVITSLRKEFKEFNDVCKGSKAVIKAIKGLGLVVEFDTLKYRYSFTKNVIKGQYKIKGLLDAIEFICDLRRYNRFELFVVDYLLDIVGASCLYRDTDGNATFSSRYVINDKYYDLKVVIDCNNFITKTFVLNEKGEKVNLTRTLKEIAITISRLKNVVKARMSGNALRYYRIRHDMTLEQLAQKSGLTLMFIYMLESNRQDIEKISFDKLMSLAKALEVHPLELTRYGVVYEK